MRRTGVSITESSPQPFKQGVPKGGKRHLPTCQHVKNCSHRPCYPDSMRNSDVAVREISEMEDKHAGDFTISTEASRYSHVQLRRHYVRKIVKAQSGFFLPFRSAQCDGNCERNNRASSAEAHFFTGPHRFGVSAKMPAGDGASNPYQCRVFAQVLPDIPAAPSQAPGNSSELYQVANYSLEMAVINRELREWKRTDNTVRPTDFSATAGRAHRFDNVETGE
jgi:hypothetical protein